MTVRGKSPAKWLAAPSNALVGILLIHYLAVAQTIGKGEYDVPISRFGEALNGFTWRRSEHICL